VINPAVVSRRRVRWTGARRIMSSLFPTIDLFEDVADPEDWPLLTAAEQKTNPRLMETLGVIDLVPAARRVGGPGASYLMAPFTHVSTDRPSRFTDGTYGVLYLAKRFETALLETMYHHARFMMRTKEAPGWASQFRELVMDLDAMLHDLRGNEPAVALALDPDSYVESQALAKALRTAGSNGLIYPSVRDAGGQCVGLFYPDWDGTRVDLYREAGTGEVFRVDWIG
jgi:hypothetical protein